MLRNFLVAVITLAPFATHAAEITGAGATFPYPVYARWADAYKKETGNTLNYQSIGSGGGIKQIQAKTVTFGATDMPLSNEELNKANLVQFPTVIGGNVLVVNIDSVTPGQMILDGETVAAIYLGKIKTWNDERIAKLNPNINLPKQSIVPVRRSDGSGTTFIFTNYLSKVSADWKKNVGEGTAVEWPVGVGAKGNEGVAGVVQTTKGAIGYVEYAYAKQNKMAHTAMINHDGKIVQPNINSFQAAAAGSEFVAEKGFYVIMTNATGTDSWPISGATFILMQKKSVNLAVAKEALKFFEFAYNNPKLAEELDYATLPSTVIERVKNSWKVIE